MEQKFLVVTVCCVCLVLSLDGAASAKGVFSKQNRESVDLKTEASGVPSNVDLKTEVSGVPSNVDLKTEASGVPSNVDLKTEVSGVPSNVDLKTEVSGVPSNVDLKTEVSGVPSNVELKTEASGVPSNVDLKTETSGVPSNVDLKTETSGVPSNFNHPGKAEQTDPMVAYLQRKQKLEGWKNITCDLCVFIVEEVHDMIERATAVETIVKEVIRICILFKIEDQRVCNMIVPQYQEEGLYVINNLILEPAEACGIILGDKCSTPYFPGQMWNISLPNTPKPAPKPPTPPQPQSPTLRFLHLTDIHIDLKYAPGSAVPCGEPLCCRVDDNTTLDNHDGSAKYHKSQTSSAGKYGDYRNCDIPMTSITSLFSQLSAIQDQFDYVIMTGDIPAHDVWSQTKTEQVSHVITLGKLFNQYLPTKPFYASVGNHESTPCNSFPPPGIPGQDMGWLYGALADSWGKWLPQDALDTVLSCGVFSVSPYPDFRIISVNNIYCYKLNWWLLLNSTDPCNVMQWLIQELQSAEDKGEKVHILMHIPPGQTDCMKGWSYNFYTIVNRYENTIVNQFYGHSHQDWYQMFYDNVTFQRPLGFGFVAPSVTTYSYNNPIYRIYTMDGDYPGSSYAVLDYTSFYLNITDANLKGYPTWQLEYSAKQAYNMTGLYARDWDGLIQRMEKDDSLFQKFYGYYRNLYPVSPCQGTCKTDMLCDIIDGRSYDPDLCKKHISGV
ncbi:sphingomyelin phosphodiesterase-like [Physella acuta]|uniref:sphingomyelin phosphodiesterase-like n=1 Tax=Physella acuta TaxID=109671 RepID=UPI0027DE57E2|nr:sphingomyelin phosphodiesterase-like [Physella acuta]